MEVETGPLDDHFPLQTGGFPLPISGSVPIFLIGVRCMQFPTCFGISFINAQTGSVSPLTVATNLERTLRKTISGHYKDDSWSLKMIPGHQPECVLITTPIYKPLDMQSAPYVCS